LPDDLVQEIATAFDVPPRPAIPTEFADGTKNSKLYLTGVTTFTVVEDVSESGTEPEPLFVEPETDEPEEEEE
jgi:hypothetical protein